MYLILYNILITFLWPFYRTLILYSPKIAEFYNQRVLSLNQLHDFLNSIPEDLRPLWLHASSVGEMDQALGVIRAVKKHHKNQIIILSVFSMSVKNLSHPEIDFMFRLPLDFFFTWPGIIKKMRPAAFGTMTWDVFPNLLYHLNRQKIPSFLCSAAIKKTSSRLRFPLLQMYRPVYRKFTGIGAADEENLKSLKMLYDQERSMSATGDSRYDTILYKINNSKLNPVDQKKLSSLKKNILILASTYIADDEAIYPRLNGILEKRPDWTVLVFPHHVDKKRIKETEQIAEKYNIQTKRYSSLSTLSKHRVLIVDKLGVLALAYKFGAIAYVGGAFHHRIHNTSEAAAWGLPVLTGPRIASSPAALALQSEEALISCETGKLLSSEFEKLMDSAALRKKIGSSGKKLVQKQTGSSEIFYRTFLKGLL